MLLPLAVLAAGGGAVYYFWSDVKSALGFGEAPTTAAAPTPAAAAALASATGTGLPLLDYQPDLGAVGSGSAGTYFPRSVAADVNALRFLGYTQLTPADVGGGVSQASDSASQRGAWHLGFQAALKSFTGNASDPWIGPSYRQKLALAVAAKNEANRAANAAAGATDAQFAGIAHRARLRRARLVQFPSERGR